MKAKFSVVLYPQPGGGFTAICPEIRGCVAQGETYEEAMDMIKDAMEGLLQLEVDLDLLLEGLAVPNKIFTEVEIDVNV